MPPAWHAEPPDAVLAALDARRDGLTAAEAARRLARFGANRLPRPGGPGLARLFLRQFKSPLIYLLLAAAAVSLAVGSLTDAGFIMVVLLLNASIGASQEWRAAKGAAALDRLLKQRAILRRDGHRLELDAEAIVPGDIVELESGAAVPADLRLLAAREMAIDESALTGESLPAAKRAEAQVAPDAPLGDRLTMLYAGTTVLAGRATGVVVATATQTEVGRIAGALSAAAPLPPLLVRLERFSRQLGLATIALIGILVLLYIAQARPAGEIFFFAVALAVSAIPEGLPVAINIALAVAARRMARENVIVRRLPAVEGLGACTLIATDKTGTLTENALAVRRLWLPEQGEIEVEADGYARHGELARDGHPLSEGEAAAARHAAMVAVLCNEGSWTHVAGEDPRYHGDTVDVALLVLGAKLGIDRHQARAAHPHRAAIPFESGRRFAAEITDNAGTARVWVKGATETVLPMCRPDPALHRAEAEAQRLAAEGYRVLALAEGPWVDDGAQSPADLSLAGLVALIDAVRPEVPAAVAAAHGAGVGVVMVTGDHPATALAIGRSIGIAKGAEQVATGAMLAAAAADRDAFDALVARTRIFARVEPLQKLAIVEALRRGGHFVAVTGDGVNDAPALRAAHIGVAMGRGGTDIARGTADLVLADDNFASIVAGIRLGRVVYDNVRKLILMLVSTAAAEILLFILAGLANLPAPLLAVQLLWLNLVTNGIQDVALAFERGEPGLLRRPPRPPASPLLDRRLMTDILLAGAVMGVLAFGFFWALLAAGWSEAAARNAVLLLMVLFENVQTLNCRSENRSILKVPLADNPLVVLAVLGTFALHAAAMHMPGLSAVLGLSSLPGAAWLWVGLLSLMLLAAVEAMKRIRRDAAAADGQRN